MRKAGYDGPINEQMRAAVALTRYQSSKAHVHFDEYSCNGSGKVSLEALAARSGGRRARAADEYLN